MQITLKQAELEDAVRGYMTGLGIGAEITEISFTATRGAEGIITTLELGGKANTAKPAGPINRAPVAPETEATTEDTDQAKLLEEAEAVLGGPVKMAEENTVEEEEVPASGKSLFS